MLDDAAAEPCPVCTIPLMHAILARERIRYCTRCRGMLIPMETFLVLIEALKSQAPGPAVPHAPEGRELNRVVRCPQCQQPMDTHYYGGPGNIVIDDCSRCYLNWLDEGELMRIVRAPDRSYAVDFGQAPGGSTRHW